MGDASEVLLFGLGAIGSFYAFVLSSSPNVKLSVVARSNYEQVKSDGLTVNSEVHGSHNFRPHQVLRNPEEADRTFDYIVCTNKAINQDEAAAKLAPVVDAKTTLVIIQNGVGNEEPFRKRFPQNTIITCVTWVGALQTSPGIIKHTKSEHTQIGLFPNPAIGRDVEQSRLDKFNAFLKTGKTPFDVEDDMQVQRWKKVVWNCAWNAITSLTLLDTQSWLKSEGGMQLTRDLMKEVIEVGQKCGVRLDYGLADELINKILAMPGIHSSMHADRVAGRQMELDMILGTPVRKAEELGMDIPITRTLYVLLMGLNVHLRQEREQKL
ncbi:ketopantoate reductase PanE/ApbA [Elsinoe australis]|uniref:2-dehydropantoate 2-reductase n=1 Tax=Elsinoe australis TaxID=40998 RepID=A0A4U7BE60_9PEZI|nr:ketopantoate reductase PanE/ApbA [Elsinoe australis]